MNRIIGIVAPEPLRTELSTQLQSRGLEITFQSPSARRNQGSNPDAVSDQLREFLSTAPDDLIVAEPIVNISAQLLRICDERGVRILPICAREDDRRFSQASGLIDHLSLELDFWDFIQQLLEACTGTGFSRAQADALKPASKGITIAVWGPHGAPGRSVISREIAAELNRACGASVCLIDADTHAPSQALALGKLDEGPGIATACRSASIGTLDIPELDRVMQKLRLSADSEISFIAGINRASRWSELGERQLADVIQACKNWRQITVIDIAASLERDEEIVSDLDGLRRNGAAIAAVQNADLVLAIGTADPLGITRLSRGIAQLREIIGSTEICVLVNRLRSAAIGMGAKNQIQTTLRNYAGVNQVFFIAEDQRSSDHALSAASVSTVLAPRAPLARSIRDFVNHALLPRTRPAEQAEPELVKTRSQFRKQKHFVDA